MARTPAPQVTLAEVRTELVALDDPRMREVNARHGADLTGLRGLAQRLRTQQPLALELWATGDADAPRDSSLDELDTMLREARLPEVHGWLVETRMAAAPDRLPWAMNHCLARIGSAPPRPPGTGRRHR